MKTYFTHSHRQYRLFKRSTEPGASFYLYFEDKGERILRSTGHAGKAEAIKWAKTFLDARADDNTAALDRLMARPGAVATSSVSQFCNWFETSPALAISSATRCGYANCFKLVLRKAESGKRKAETQNTETLSLAEALTKDTVLGYLEAVNIEARAATDQSTAAQIRRSAASILNQAKSLFSLLSVEHARRAGLLLPSTVEFLATVKLARKELLKGSTKEDFHPPDDAVINATLATWRALDLTQRESCNVYAAIWLALSCGLRCSEMAQARWEWFTVQDGAPLLNAAGASVKNQSGNLRVRPVDPFWNEGWNQLKAESGKRKAEMVGPILVGENANTAELTFRSVSNLMRVAGWRTQKVTHALRALAGSYVAARFGIFEAQGWLRHASVNTTEKSYTVLLRDKTFKPLPVEWAINNNGRPVNDLQTIERKCEIILA